jgi:hypothetical protein
VMGILIFHAIDESALDRFQSGLYYADTTPKSSLPAVRDAVRQAHGGVIARCPGLKLTPQAKVAYPRIRSVGLGTAAVAITCDIDCNVYARLERLPRHSTTLATRAKVLAGERTLVPFRRLRLAPGRYRFTVRMTAPVNVGPSRTLFSPPLIVR